MNKIGVSVVICTYNGSANLPETIRHIAMQEVPPHIDWEFVIINNASTDNTAEVALAEWRKYNSKTILRIVDEPMPGLSYARSKGFETARFDYVLLCDDDNWLNKDYVRIVFEVMSSHANIGALGGNGDLVYEKQPPDWVLAFPIFAAGEQAKKSGRVKKNFVYGAGCVIRKSAYDLIHHAGFRSILTDRLGKELSSGGDYELCFGLVMGKYDIWYDERLKFSHYIPAERFTQEYYIRYLRESSKCFEVIEPYKIVCNITHRRSDNFYLLMAKIFIYYLRKYLTTAFLRMFYRKNSLAHTLHDLRAYSIRMKINAFLDHPKVMLNNYRYGITVKNRIRKLRHMVHEQKVTLPKRTSNTAAIG